MKSGYVLGILWFLFQYGDNLSQSYLNTLELLYAGFKD